MSTASAAQGDICGPVQMQVQDGARGWRSYNRERGQGSACSFRRGEEGTRGHHAQPEVDAQSPRTQPWRKAHPTRR